MIVFMSCGKNESDNENSSSGNAKFENIDSFSNQIFVYIINDNLQGLQSLLPTQSEFESILGDAIKEALSNGSIDSQQARRSGSLDINGKLNINPNASKEFENLFNKNYKNFKRYSKGLNFGSKDYKLLYTNYVHNRDRNVETLDITYILRNGVYKKDIEIKVRGCMKSKDSWLIGERIDYPDGRVREYESSSQFYFEY